MSKQVARLALAVTAAIAIAAVIPLLALTSNDGAPSAAPPIRPTVVAVTPSPALPPRSSSSTPAPERVDPRQTFASAVAAADRGEPVPPGEVVALIDRSLAATGATSEPWTRDAERVFADLALELAARRDQIAVSSPQCFAAGCIVTLDFPPNADVVALTQSLATSRAVASWPGSKLASPAVVDARNAATTRLVLVRPDAL